jgi:hypothetical protein
MHHQTTAYQPELNGAVERLHFCLKDVLRACQMNFCKEMKFLLTQFQLFFLIFGCSCFFFAQAQFKSGVFRASHGVNIPD